MKLRLLFAAVLSTAVVAGAAGAGTRSAAVVDRVQVGVPGANDTRDFSPALHVTLRVPKDYRRGCCFDGNSGQWLGPPVVQTKGGVVGDSSIGWSVGFRKDGQRAEQAARSGLIQNYPPLQAATIEIPHVVAGRNAGSIRGSFLITQFAARVEAAVAFPIGRGVLAVVAFDALSPPQDNAAPFGEYRVNDQLASSWNREQIQAAIQGVGLDGSLPPARVAAAAAAGGRLVVGQVLDSFGHPVAGATARLLQGAGRRWQVTGETTRTDARGRYSLHVRGGRGTYRVAGSLRGAAAFTPPVTALSSPVVAGR